MPRPADTSQNYLPGLDGLRAIAVIGVIGYHLGFTQFGGGLLGVGVFFTLSGFLITSILMTSWTTHGSLELKRFWVRRARRLLPALFLVLAVVLLWTWRAHPGSLSQRWSETWPALGYVANWSNIAAEQSYFARFEGPGPLDHMWSLSVEEQFYIAWPVLLLLAFGVAKLRRRHVFGITVALAAVSFLLLALMATPGFDNSRAYQGTDTRAGGILLGAALALAWPGIERIARAAWAKFAIQLLGLAGLVGIGWLMATTDQFGTALYSWGLLLLSVCTLAVLAAVALPGSVLGAALGVAPLRWLGERSYGVYLWHLPVIVAIPAEAMTQQRLAWSAVAIVSTLVLAELSWRLVENPIRQHGFRGALGRVRESGLRNVPVGVGAVCVLGTLSLVACSAVNVTSKPAPQITAETMAMTPTAPPPATDPNAPTSPSTPTPPPIVKVDGVPQTSCTSVVHIGESTSLGLIDAYTLPDRATRLPAQLRRVGAKEVRTDILGARSIVERWNEQPNAQDAVITLNNDGFKGCFSIAMGTNDAANESVGGVKARERIDDLMKLIGGQPVLWMTVRTLNSTGPYADSNMNAFNKVLVDACSRYPNLRIYDWRSETKDPWFISDGIHFNSEGNAERAHRIARAFSTAYPAGRPPVDKCMVGSGVPK